MLFSLILGMLSCSTEVGLMGYVEKNQDTAETIIDSQPGPTSEPSEEEQDTSVLVEEIEGVGGYVNYYLRQIACPACVGENQELLVEFKAKFHEPINDSHTTWIPEVGTCTNQLLMTVPSTNPIDVGQQIFVEGSQHSFIANRTSVGEHYAYLYETQYDRNALHEVELIPYSEGFSFSSIEGFDFIEPYNMFYVDPSYAFDAAILRSGMTFTWSPYGSSGIFMVTLAIYSSDGSQLLGYSACTGPDQGFLTFPSAYLSSFPSYSLVLIHLARHKVNLIPYPPLNSFIESHMEWEVIGTGYLQ